MRLVTLYTQGIESWISELVNSKVIKYINIFYTDQKGKATAESGCFIDSSISVPVQGQDVANDYSTVTCAGPECDYQ